MSLAEQLAKESEVRPGTMCQVCKVIPELSKDDIAALTQALSSAMSSSAIARALRNEGHAVHDKAVGRHRRQECAREFAQRTS